MVRSRWRARGLRSLVWLVLPGAAGVALCSPTILGGGTVAAPPAQTSTSEHLIFDDEFDGRRGAAPGPAWIQQVGGGVWGGGQPQTYTRSRANSYLDGHGRLVIVGRRNPGHGKYPFTSARLASRASLPPYVRIETRVKIPTGDGLWPALWLLGGSADPKHFDWPRKGEVDVVEAYGKVPNQAVATVHGYSTDANTPFIPHRWYVPTTYRIPVPFSESFHTWTVEKRRDSITWWFDGRVVKTFTKSQVPPNGVWSFDYPMHLIVNLGMGSPSAGYPDATTKIPAAMIVDYVRVWSIAP